MLFSPFTSMSDMARGLLPFLPTSLLIKHRFENERKIAAVRAPIFLVHGSGDRIIPCRMSHRLRSGAGGPVTFVEVETDHNDLFELAGDQIFDQLGKFLAENFPAGGN
jgi:fermentation-respiration switch protein FrsA (DUF1100 family)